MGGVNDEMHISESPQLGVVEKQVLVSTAHLKALGEKWFRVYVNSTNLSNLPWSTESMLTGRDPLSTLCASARKCAYVCVVNVCVHVSV